MLKQDKVCGWCRKTDELVLMVQGGGVHTVCPECGSTGPYLSTNEVGKAYRELLARHNALRDAVAWERECCQDIRPLVAWADLYARHGEDYVDAIAEALREIQDAARSEVDRLLEEKH